MFVEFICKCIFFQSFLRISSALFQPTMQKSECFPVFWLIDSVLLSGWKIVDMYSSICGTKMKFSAYKTRKRFQNANLVLLNSRLSFSMIPKVIQFTECLLHLHDVTCTTTVGYKGMSLIFFFEYKGCH